jgi:rhomboid protease GluP
MLVSIFTRSGDWRDFYRQSPVTTIIFTLNTLMLFAVLFTGGFSNGIVSNWAYINHDLIVNQGEYYRLITGAFQHWDFLHFIFNMVIGVIVLSSALERLIGSKKFAIVYFTSLLLSSIAVAYLETDMFVRTAGASGAIFGVMGALLWLSFFRRDILGERDIQSVWVLVAFQVISTFAAQGVSIIGHLSGVISGFLLMYILLSTHLEESKQEDDYFH